ncbi:hypothetical protein TNCV_3402101 [Trichonephila clavipes]|nr:hypothetical protein TNCV_3402101 [Trichonephila clavipes]
MLANKKDFDCTADTVSINKSPERNFLTYFESPPIPLKAFCMSKGNFSDISLLGASSTSSWHISTHHGVQQGRRCAGHLAKTRPGAYLEYTPEYSAKASGRKKKERMNGMTRKMVENREGLLRHGYDQENAEHRTRNLKRRWSTINVSTFVVSCTIVATSLYGHCQGKLGKTAILSVLR